MGLILGLFCLCTDQTPRAFGQTPTGSPNSTPASTGNRSDSSPPDQIWVLPDVPSPVRPNATLRQPWFDNPSPPLLGTIVDFDSENLTFLDPKTNRTRRIESYRVQKLDFQWATPQSEQAAQEAQQGDLRTAINLARETMQSGQLPTWQQRILTTRLIEGMIRENRYITAKQLFVTLSNESIPPLLYSSIPLVWNDQRPDAAMTTAARESIANSSATSIEKLIAASWLIHSTGQDLTLARTTLTSLANSDSPNRPGTNPSPYDRDLIPKLATAQLWRIADPIQANREIEQWQNSRDQLPPQFQLGPTIALAIKWERIGKHETALQEWIRAATLYDPLSPWTQQSKRECNRLLDELRKSRLFEESE